MEIVTGSSTSTKSPLLIRMIVLGITVAAVVIAFAAYVPQDIGRIYPPANLIGHTWYGPTLLILVPIALGWLSVGIKRTWLKVLAFSLTVLLLLGCLAFIYGIKEQSGTLPNIIRRGHVL